MRFIKQALFKWLGDFVEQFTILNYGGEMIYGTCVNSI